MDMLAGQSTGTKAGKRQKGLEERGKKMDKQDERQEAERPAKDRQAGGRAIR